MSSKQAQVILTPLGLSSRKRKGGEGRGFDAIKASKRATTTTTTTMKMANTHNDRSKAVVEAEPMVGKDNRVLAGYLAHEFLTKGTLLGEKWDPARAEATPIAPVKPNLKQRREATAAAAANSAAGNGRRVVGDEVAVVEKQHQSYAEVANLLKSDGVHIEGVFNPTHLARWLKM